MIKSYHFDSGIPGPCICFLGAVHGNEHCGQIAIDQLISHMQQGHIILDSGSITCIPICNPQAYQKNIRYIDKNLNRVFTEHKNPKYYEEHIANELCSIISKSDILVDLHSGHTDGAYFVFQDYEDAIYSELVHASGCETVIHGRAELYEATQDQDTGSFAHSIGIPGITIECGKHDGIQSPIRAYNCILSILLYYKLISHKSNTKRYIQKHITMKKIFYYTSPGILTQNLKHGDLVSSGTTIAQLENGEVIQSKEDCIIILPNHNPQQFGDEWFYIGEYI